MKTEKLNNGKVRLSAPGGVIDTRNGQWYSEAIVKKENVKFLKEKKMKWLSKVAARAGIDGLLHVIISAIIVLVIQMFSPWWAAVLVAFLIGVAKELIWDLWFKKGQMQVKDFICDAVGVLIGCLGFL